MPNAMRPIPPGEILKEQMVELKLSANALAKALRVPTNRVTGILNGTRAITADTALRLARFFGMSPVFWMNLQQSFDLRTEAKRAAKRIEREVQPIVIRASDWIKAI